jgi:hypothetical protein
MLTFCHLDAACILICSAWEECKSIRCRQCWTLDPPWEWQNICNHVL